ncbi:UNVERIFIED_CONTAM: hypothetical protein Scaly_1154500 [Sesamum calycinum]|uniref:DUF7046 domain-containing protein n=1 Tax=Sesamum calycinum TaxID=2727403 RepID=A0AAW2Q2K8_9LAMI
MTSPKAQNWQSPHGVGLPLNRHVRSLQSLGCSLTRKFSFGLRKGCAFDSSGRTSDLPSLQILGGITSISSSSCVKINQDDVVLSKRNPVHKLVWPIEKETIEMENGEGNLESKFARLTVTDPYNINGNDGLFQVMKAVEAAEATIKQQDIAVKVRENEEEILQLKKHLTEFSIKEAQIQNEKYALGSAFDQQQQDLVLAASKAISYRQDIMEENVRLTYALQAAKQERLTFVSSLMPLLAEYSLQPPVADAQSIVSNVKIGVGGSLYKVVQDTKEKELKVLRNLEFCLVLDISGNVLFRHLQEQLLVTEVCCSASKIVQDVIRNGWKAEKSQYQLAPWRSDVNPSNFAQSPVYPIEIKNGLELVPQPTFSDGKMPSSDRQTSMVEDILGLPQSGRENLKNFEHDELERHPPLASRNITLDEVPSQLVFSQAEQHTIRNNEGTVGKKVTFGDLVRSKMMMSRRIEDTRVIENLQQIGILKLQLQQTMDDPNSSYSPYLPPVLEEPSSSFSEAADDDPLPAIEGLQISGEAFPGQQLQACGYSINGTTSCNFEWVRHLEDGSFNYVDGAKQPNYLVTADDVETYLAIEVQPLDDRKRKVKRYVNREFDTTYMMAARLDDLATTFCFLLLHDARLSCGARGWGLCVDNGVAWLTYGKRGELVKVFANEHRKITCDPVMHNCIERTLYTGHASYKLSLSTGYLDIWEPATLAIKRDGYSIKCSGPSGVVVAEKFSSSTIVSIPYGSPTEFSIIDSQGTERILRVDANSTDIRMIGWAYLESVCTWVQVGRDPNVEGVDLGVFVINRRAGAFCKFPPDLEIKRYNRSDLEVIHLEGNPQKQDLNLITDPLIFSKSSRTDEK